MSTVANGKIIGKDVLMCCCSMMPMCRMVCCLRAVTLTSAPNGMDRMSEPE